MSPKILIIGSGLTGALCSFGLSKALPLSTVTLWDKARGAGGRMTTTRTDNGNKADLGAQYITTTKENLERYKNEYDPLLRKGTLSQLTAPVEGMKHYSADDVVHFVAPDGMGSVVKTILAEANARVIYDRHVYSILADNGKYKVTAQDGNIEECDIIISTIPVPQFLNLPDAEKILNQENKEKLKQVEYSTRFVLIWFYTGENGPKPQWGSKYLNDEIFRYVAVDNIKRNRPNEPTTIVFHSSIQYGEKNKMKTKVEMVEELTASAKRLFPDWPSPSSSKCHKWLYSQVTKPYQGTDGCLKVTQKPTLILAGDAFTESNFNGCIESAKAAVKLICN